MNKLPKILITTAAMMTSLSAFAHEGAGEYIYGDNGYLSQHAELSVKLPFNSPFCDLNDNHHIDADELNDQNICLIPGTNELFAEKPIASLGLKSGQLALTIDDGPNKNVTPRIFDLLDQYGIKATFFVTGSRIKGNADIIREAVKRGHTIGNHTYSHCLFKADNCGPIISSETIVGEVKKAYGALTDVLGGDQPTSRNMFRAPGLGWSSPKALSLNSDKTTRNFIGPIHANIGADAPKADWSCWSHGVSAEQCADWYFGDIVDTGHGIILSHDIFFKEGKGNTYEMLKILLKRLDTEAGGIKNAHNGKGVWEFVRVTDQSALDKYDTGVHQTTPAPVAIEPVAYTEKSADGFTIIRTFAKPTANVRSGAMIHANAVTPESLIDDGHGGSVKVGSLVLADLGKTVQIGDLRFKQVRVEDAGQGLEDLKGSTVYVWEAAFN